MSSMQFKEYLSLNKALLKEGDLIQIYDPIIERQEFLKFGNFKNCTLLDIGAGKGTLSIIAAKYNNCQVLCVDNNSKKIELSKQRVIEEGLSEKISFEFQDVRSMTYSDNSFSYITCYSTLHHIEFEDRKKAILEIVRVAKERVLFGEITPEGANYFDEVLHPEENHQKIVVPMEWLISIIEGFGTIRILHRPATYFISLDKSLRFLK